MTIFNVGGGGGGGSLTFKEMTSGPYEIKESDWGTATSQVRSDQFNADTRLTKITLPSNFTYIGSNAFQGCRNLTSITIMNTNTFTQIQSYAFSGCYALTDFEFPKNITTIQTYVLQNCQALENLTISETVTNIKTQAFNNVGISTANGVTITMLGSTPPSLVSTAFTNASINKIIVPQGSLTAYQTATNWSAYASYMEEAP